LAYNIKIDLRDLC